MKKRIKISPFLLIYFLLCLYFNNIVYYLTFLFSLLIHELGHIFFILLYNGKIKEFSLNIFGGVIKYNVYKDKGKLLISLGRNNF